MSQPNHPSPSASLYLDLMKKVLAASIYEESSWWVVYMELNNWRTDADPIRRFKNHLKFRFLKFLENRNYLLIKRMPFDMEARKVGRDWPNLVGFTMIGLSRLDNVQYCVEKVIADKIEGDLIETGAWRGGTTIFMRAILKAHGDIQRKVWVADSFEGLPVPKNEHDGNDLSAVQMLKVSQEQVEKNFEKFDLLDGQVQFLKGWFCDTLPKAPVEKLAVLRLDGDLYSSTMDALTHLYPKVSKGGYVIVDDYYSWPSCRAAVTDYLSAHQLTPTLIPIDGDGVYWRCE